jgi:2'-5' RNA ligase
MRAFISLNLDEKTREEVKKYKNILRDKLNRNDLDNIKWEAEDKYHITLFFIGDVKDGLRNLLKQELDNIGKLNIGKIEFEFDRVSAFPDLRNPRVLYLDVKDNGGKSFVLSKEVEDRMNFLGFEQNKKFVPHITLGRVRKNERIQMRDVNIKCEGEKFTIVDMCLMKSMLTSRGSYYDEVHRVKL